MIPLKRKILSLVFTIIVLISLSGTVSGYHLSERSYQLVSACYTDHLIEGYGNVPEYRPDGTVITTGIIEGIRDEKGMWDWYFETEQITNNTRSEIKEYFFPNGPVISYGSNLLGTICVGIWKEADTVKKTRDDIYAIIDTEAKTRGIEDVPVIFIRESIPDTRLLLIPDPAKTAFVPPIHEIASGYPAYTPQNSENKSTSGIIHSSIAFLIEKITPGYWPCYG